MEDRVTISSFYFDDAAADWYDRMHRNHQLNGWQAFTATVLERFRSRDLEEPEGLLAKLQQVSSVSHYQSQFEAIANRTMNLPARFPVHCFISGLRGDIKHSVLVHQPNTLVDAMNLALLHEQRINLEKGFLKPSLGNSKLLLPTPNVPPATSVAPPTATLPIDNRVPFQCLTQTEAAQRRAKGLCYNCDEKYTSDHKCKAKPHLVLLEEESAPIDATDPSLLPPPHGPDVKESVEVPPEPVDEPHSAISYNALAGGCSVSTLRFQGLVQGKTVQVLFDGGSTHNFVQP